MEWIEYIGLAASIIIAISMVFKTTNIVGTLLMRSINAVGSSLFLVYAHMIHSAPVFVLNSFTLLLSIFYFVKELIDYKKHKKE